jgi:hypothetical protein
MFFPRPGTVCGTFLAGLCVLNAGCQSPQRVGRSQPSEATPAFFARAPQSQVLLDAGMEVSWQAQTAQDQPGQVKAGTGMVGPDGTMVIGPYGTCKVAGLNIDQAAQAVEKQLALYLPAPNVQLTATVPSQQANLAFRPARATAPSTGNGETVVMLTGDNAVQPAAVRSADARLISTRPETISRSKVIAVTEAGSAGDGAYQVAPGDAAAAKPSPFEKLRVWIRTNKAR